MKASIIIPIILLACPAFGQTIYKCPSPTPGAPPVIQQMPCSPTGGGETATVKPINTTGSTLEISEPGQKYMKGNEERWTAQAEADEKERQRQEALNVERAKAKAAAAQAAAQYETANAIRAMRQRY